MKAIRRLWRGASAVVLLLLAGCGSLLPKAPAPPAFYTLGQAQPAATAGGAAVAWTTGPTLIVSPLRAAAGFDSAQMLYIRQPHRLEHFANSQWVDTPARMTQAPMLAALAPGAHWRATVAGSGSASGELRLDTELIRLQHDFTRSPSRVRLTLRATLVESASRRVLAAREIDTGADAPSEDAYGGVLAAQQALHDALATLRAFCEDAAARWRPATPVP